MKKNKLRKNYLKNRNIESVNDKIFSSILKRSPWILINLITATFSSFIICFFENYIAQMPKLAVFMPLVASLGGNTGSQTLAVLVRSLVLGEIKKSDQLIIFVSEIFKGFLLGIAISLIIFLIGWIQSKDFETSIIIVIASIINMTIASFSGSIIPFLINHIKFDPAQSSSIFLTAVTDVSGFLLFLGLGSWLLTS
jgi:magnesium transporter